MLKMNGEQRSMARELRVFKGKGRGRFRPDEKVGRVIGRREAQLLDFLEIARVSTKPVRRVLHSFRKVGLDGAGEVIGGSSRDETRTDGHDRQNENGSRSEDRGANSGG